MMSGYPYRALALLFSFTTLYSIYVKPMYLIFKFKNNYKIKLKSAKHTKKISYFLKETIIHSSLKFVIFDDKNKINICFYTNW